MSDSAEETPLENPYRAPTSSLAPPASSLPNFLGEESISEEVDRTNNLGVETTLKTIGLIFMLTPVISIANVCIMSYSPRFSEILAKQAATTNVDLSTFRIVMFVATLFGGVIIFLLGLGLRSLKNWARWIFVILGVFGLFGTFRTLIAPVPGTLNSLAALSLVITGSISLIEICFMFLPGAGHVCSKHYQFVIATTPQIRPTLGLRDKLLLGAFGTNALLGLASGFF